MNNDTSTIDSDVYSTNLVTEDNGEKPLESSNTIKRQQTIPAFHDMLKSEKQGTILDALQDLSSFSAHAQLLVPKIVTLSSHQNKLIRLAAITALAKFKSDEKLIICTIKKALHDSEASIRRSAASALAHFAPASQAAVYDLADRVLNDEDTLVQELCCHTLSELGPDAEPALPALVHLLRRGTDKQRMAACRTIAKIGAKASLAKPALIQALKDSNGHVRDFAGSALGHVKLL